MHHHLIRAGLRTSVGIVVESAEPREVHHFCCLAGYGAEAINPYLAFETLTAMKNELPQKLDEKEILKRYIKSIDKGLLKVMSKMGISTYQSYCGAQIFDAIGLKSDFVAKYFTGTATRIEGVGLAEIAQEAVDRHRDAFSDSPIYRSMLDVGGEYAFRVRGEDHVWNAATVSALQHAVRGNSYDKYRQFAGIINDQSERLLTIRGLFRIKSAAEDGRKPVPIEEVEPAKDIVRRFSTGAMSFGSISREAHTTLAIAMNRIGGKSNTGEGGEESDRFKPLPNGDSMRSAIKQVASGPLWRHRRVSRQLRHDADQDRAGRQARRRRSVARPQGRQGHRQRAALDAGRGPYLAAAASRHLFDRRSRAADLRFEERQSVGRRSASSSSPRSVSARSPPASPRRAPTTSPSPAMTAAPGPAPLTSVKHAGSPWEIGLAETHQTLVANGLRGRIAVQVDGGIRTGRDVVVGALLGAEEFGFATAPLIAAGCIMMRKCHLNTCPVGVATQDPVLRKRFTGQPEHIINYFFFVAEEVRELMAELGYRTVDEMIGQMQMFDRQKLIAHGKASGLDFSKLFVKPDVPKDVATYNRERQDHKIHDILDRKLIAQSKGAIERATPVQLSFPIRNVDRTVGAMLSGEIAKRYGHDGLPADTIVARFTGTAGQSFGAFLARGVTFELEGDANDYVGKSLSGGRIVVRPPAESGIVPEQSIIVGNTVLYGAIEGECYFRGVAGERFAVRNSGAVAVIEGAGDHCCEYMTGGVVIVLGPTGRNFAAGMSGGVAYVLDGDASFASRCNLAMVELEPMPGEEDINSRIFHQSRDLETQGLVDINADMSRFDAHRLHHFISRHARFTGSAIAAKILADWKTWYPKFHKVMPVEYRRALNEMKAAAIAAE